MSPTIKQHKVGIAALVLLLILGCIYVSLRDTAQNNAVFCTMDAKQCPDGSYVGRVGPSCEFSPCPTPPQATQKKIEAVHLSDVVPVATSSLQIFTPVQLPKASATVRYSELGFLAATTTIKQYQTVDFINTSNHSFWPASNDHPGHTLYPEFDARTPITTGNKFTFTFNVPGVWNYHNHLKPSQHGVIIVTPVPTATSTGGTL